jgi:uncharacterized protein YjaZ
MNKLVGGIVVVMVSVVLAGQNVMAAPAAERGPKIINIMPAFWSFEAEAGKLKSDSARVRLFRERVIEPYSNIYGLKTFKSRGTDKAIAKYLQWVRPYLPRMRQLTAQVSEEIKPALSRFMKAFPDFDGSKVTIVFMPSLRDFNGQMDKSKNGGVMVLFGIDIMAWQGKNADLPVIFTHELFHAYHYQVNAKTSNDYVLYAALWSEGLATYVSQKLNPGTSEAAALQSRELADADPSSVPKIARAFIGQFSSTSHASFKEFFHYFFHGKPKWGLPSRSGYLLGYCVCEQVGRKYSLQQMAHLHDNYLKALIHNAIVSLTGKNPAIK